MAITPARMARRPQERGPRFIPPRFAATPDPVAHYNLRDLWRLVYDSSNRVTDFGDRSGNSSVNVLCLNGVAGNYASAPNAAPLQVTGDIDLRCQVAMGSWTPAADSFLISKWLGGGASNSYALVVMNTGVLRLYISTTGADFPFVSSSVAPTVSAYGTLWVRATRVQASGTVTFYTSTDGTQWTQLGTTGTISAGASIFNGTQKVSIGSDDNGTNNRVSGRIYRAQIYNGINGTLAFDANFAIASKLAGTFTESSANAATVTINTTGDLGARICGARDLVNLTAANKAILLLWSGNNYLFSDGSAGNYASTPSSAALQFNGSDLDIATDEWLTSWAPASNDILVAKAASVIPGALEYLLQLDTAGTLTLYWSTGAATLSATSTVAISAAAGSRLSCRATLQVNNGAGGYTVTFYTGTTFGTWTQLGNSVVGGAPTSIQNSTNELAISAFSGGASGHATGGLFRLVIKKGINGTTVLDVNPGVYTSGTTFTEQSSNAATVTINGGDTVVTRTCLWHNGSSHYLKAAGFAQSQPVSLYLAGQQVSWTSTRVLFDGGSITTMQAIQTTASPQLNISAGSSVAANTGLALQTPGVFTGIFNGASSSDRVNRLTAVTGNAGTGTPNGITLGATASATLWANMTDSELILYSAAHDTVAQNRMAVYLGLANAIAV